MMTPQDLRFVALIAAASSLAAVARRLDISPSAVTQRLRHLEERLQVRLVDRSSRRLQLTAEGSMLAERGAAVLAELEAMTEALAAGRGAVTGHLRVAAPFGFGRAYVAPAMVALRQAHPGLEMSLILFEDPAHSLRDGQWDVMVHVGHLPDSRLVLRRLAPNRRILCAAPAYLAAHGTPSQPEDLRHHACAVIRENQADTTLWPFTHAEGHGTAIRVHPALASNDGAVVRQWGLAGLGIILRSEWDVAEDLRSGALVALVPDWTPPPADVVALLGARNGRMARTERFLQVLGQALRPVPWRG
ncbi:LysR family transcriptional regulator [Roseomonas aerophila]|uniref:LysR family transcriptional regulator n=2 Tax=Teichococcus aerophilus TaxID=1224513 RepID=A0ABR7RFV6_9PROT|nr:LysR family transcriptional regulator [Pseudoroseomonas aerophila]